MTPAERIAFTVLEGYSGPWYVAATIAQRERILAEAARAIAPMLDELTQKSPVPNGTGEIIRTLSDDHHQPR